MVGDLLFWLLGAPAWAVGGGVTAKKAIAQAERHYLELSKEAHRKNAQIPIQDKMDGDDWIGASLYATAAFVAFPAIAAVWMLARPFRFLFRPVRKWFMPPIQKEFEEHVERVEAKKEIILATAKTYNDVLGWEPKDHPDRVGLLKNLQGQIVDQMQDLMQELDPKRAFDGNFLSLAKDEVRELTAGETWRG